MKREDLRAIEGMTDEIVNAVMRLAGQDSTAAQQREAAIQTQLETAQAGLAAFGTQKPTDLAEANARVAQLQQQLDAQAADFRFRTIARNTAVAAGAIDPEDVVGLLAQNEVLRKSTNLDTDVQAAVQALKTETKKHWFTQTQDPDPKKPGVVVPKPNGQGAGSKDPTPADFAMMDYMARLELKAKNPALFTQLSNQLRAAGRTY